MGRKLDAIVLSEIGGMNSVIPVAAAAIAGIPLVNVDGMGRAFPGLQQDSYNIAGVHTWPMAFADEKGNVAMLTTVDNDWMENLGRATVDAMGGQGIALGQFMSGETMKRAAVRDSPDPRRSSSEKPSDPSNRLLRMRDTLRLVPLCSTRSMRWA